VPERFFAMLEAEGLEIERCPLPDHHDYDTLPWSPSDPDVIVTEKDAVKLRPERTLNTRVWVAPLDFEPEPAFAEALARRLEKGRGRRSAIP
jgi:tetraacyldisaccharide 4'-kinase